jgi:hypothetical protein
MGDRMSQSTVQPEPLLRHILALEQSVNLLGLAMENLVLAVVHGNRNTAKSLQAGNKNTGKQGECMAAKQRPGREKKKMKKKGKPKKCGEK